MIYVYSLIIISLLLLKVIPIDWTTMNGCLILISLISISELFRSLFNHLVPRLKEISLHNSLELRDKLEKFRKELMDWHKSLTEATKETAVLQLKSSFVLLNYTVQINDKKMFDTVIKKLQSMKVPNDSLFGCKQLELFIKDVDDGKYKIEFDKETRQPYFVLIENSDDEQ